MQRTITVKGEGKATAKPDQAVLSMSLESRDKKYDRAMEQAAQHIQRLNEALCAIGFGEDDVKTVGFNVDIDYDQSRDKKGIFHKDFKGYVVKHQLKLKFDLDQEKLSQALSVISKCLSEPQLSIEFTVKDATAVNEEMLRSAAANAKRKAELLCEGSGAALGQLLTIDYNWNEISFFSRTRFGDTGRPAPFMSEMEAPTAAVPVVPEDINVRDTATFVWEIV